MQSLYLTGNTLRLHYKAQPVNAVKETVAVYCENHTTHAYAHSMGKIQSYIMLNKLVNIVTTEF
jgi:hypothetical protein